ncbi:hypothetical protein [Catelliglobosispora koreensis]|uniref:hypothetical protein n=1 Tax=Catelliglobosispora koreensis TaxID=129052 RepID=UPI00039D50C5|nr:hypothetical protein [Catelliglobosispora koreensis]
MSTVLLITDDEKIHAEVQRCARESGVHIVVHDSVRAALPSWKGTDMVLLGGDQARAATAYLPLPDPKPRDIITVDGDNCDPWEFAADLGADYVVVLPIARQWLVGQLDNLPDHPVTAMKKAGFHVGYADPAEVARFDSLAGWEVRQYFYGDAQCPYVALDEIARDVCKHGQSSTVVRSNYRTLKAAYPGTFSDVRYSNVDALGAFVADLSPELVDTLIGLREQYPLFDDSDHSELEEEDILESWSWVKDQLWDRISERVKDVWIAMPDVQAAELWWEVVDGLGYRPEHDGRDVQWDLDLLAGPYAARLMSEFRRTFRPHPAFTMLARDTRGDRRPAPGFAIVAEGFPFLLAQAWSRFSARTQMWAHQRDWLATIAQARTVSS